MTASKDAPKFGERFFGILLGLLPEEFRDRFSGEMQLVFRDQRQDAAQSGPFAQMRFWWDTSTGLLSTAVREHREILLQDGTYALRMMRKDLGFTCVAILILGLAIGAATAAFSAANAILIQPLPFADGDRLVQLKQTQPAVGIDDLAFSVKEIEDYRSRNHTLDSSTITRVVQRWPSEAISHTRPACNAIKSVSQSGSTLRSWPSVHRPSSQSACSATNSG